MKRLTLILILAYSTLFSSDVLQLVRILDQNNTEQFKHSIQTTTDANAAREDNNKTILMYAVWIGNDEAVHHLVDKGADINAVDSNGASALHLAVWKERTPIALYLMKHGASYRALSHDGMTPADIAAIKQNKNVLEAIDHANKSIKPLLLD